MGKLPHHLALPGVLLLTPLLLSTSAAPEIFVDVAARSGIDFVHFNGMSGEHYLLEITGAGGALVDYDGDGDLDVYLVQGHMLGEEKSLEQAIFPPYHPIPLTDRLYRNDQALEASGEPTLRFLDVTASSRLQAASYGMGVIAGDYDNDGWTDLYRTSFGPNQMLRNNGDGTFTDVTVASGTDDPRWSVPASFFDYDRDGWLDLYVGNYVRFNFTLHTECANSMGVPGYCGPLSYSPLPDRLLHNRRDGSFENVSASAGIEGDFGNALGTVSGDFNGDGWLDLYVANDQVPNLLWINQQDGTLRNEALLAGCAVNDQGMPEASMGVDAADIDGDGDEDIFMGHLTGETNTLFLNDGRGMFTDATRPSGLGHPSWSLTTFGTAWLDFDHDGWLDLIIVNGAVLIIPELAAKGDPFPLHQPNKLFRNRGDGGFEDVTRTAGEVFLLSEVSRGAVPGDVDNDGDIDVLITNNAGPARLLVNTVGEHKPWLGVRPLAATSGRDLLGTLVGVHRPGLATLWRRSRTDGSYASSRDPRVTVGLGPAVDVDWIELVWPDGGRSRFESPPVAHYLVFPRRQQAFR